MGTNAADRNFRCSTQARERGDALPGTASTARAFFLLEEWGPWGKTAYLDSRFAPGVGAALQDAAKNAGVRPLLIKQGRKPAGAPRRVFAAFVSAKGCWVQSTEVSDPAEALDLDFAALAQGTSLGLDPWDTPIFAVCTHSGHDICCAERGRPVVEHLNALAQDPSGGVDPSSVWSVSHLGGDRFAGNMVIVNDGLFYGGLDARSAEESVRAYLRGELSLDTFRGRAFWKPVVQAAEVALRRELQLCSVPPLRALAVKQADLGQVVTFEASRVRFAVTMYRTLGEPAQLTCHSESLSRPRDWLLQSIRRL